jgi:hypothetical protein
MRLAGTAPADIAATVGLTPRRLAGRVQAIVAAVAVPAAERTDHDLPLAA